jgi:hypothetical protein
VPFGCRTPPFFRTCKANPPHCRNGEVSVDFANKLLEETRIRYSLDTRIGLCTLAFARPFSFLPLSGIWYRVRSCSISFLGFISFRPQGFGSCFQCLGNRCLDSFRAPVTYGNGRRSTLANLESAADLRKRCTRPPQSKLYGLMLLDVSKADIAQVKSSSTHRNSKYVLLFIHLSIRSPIFAFLQKTETF